MIVRMWCASRNDPIYRECQAPVGFVSNWQTFGLVLLGGVGFLDQFTVTASRFSQAVAVEERDAFDDRFGTILSD